MTGGPVTGNIAVGVSACLLGEKVRYDGGHKHDCYITDTLGKFLTFVPVCPEVECGMPIPREAMRLEDDPAAPRLMTRQSRIDKTEQMLSFCRAKVAELANAALCGFIFKKNSPSSGLFRVKVYNRNNPVKTGRGLFADAVVKHFPLLPVEEEGRLHDMGLRENFIVRVFAYRRWRNFLRGSKSPGELVTFHTAHKLLIMAHNPLIYRQMGGLTANAGAMPAEELLKNYEGLLMRALSHHATIRKNVDVLMHIMGYFKKELSGDEKTELREVIGQYHNGMTPLCAPLTLLRHYVRKFDQQYLKQQVYLNPHPLELMLRNHG